MKQIRRHNNLDQASVQHLYDADVSCSAVQQHTLSRPFGEAAGLYEIKEMAERAEGGPGTCHTCNEVRQEELGVSEAREAHPDL